MKVLALVPNRKGYSPGQRGSIELWESVLRDEGIELDFEPFESEELRRILYSSGHTFGKARGMIGSYFERLRLLRDIDAYDAVFIYREAALFGPAILERMAARKKPIIYQLDDPLFMPYKSPSNGYLSYLKFFGKVKEIIRISKTVIVNSTPIREYAEAFSKNIWQIPSIVDTAKFDYRPFPTDIDRVCIGWSGSPTTLKNLKVIEQPLGEISQADICDIHFIGGKDLDLDGVNYTSQLWNGATEAEDLRRMQVGLAPLPENSWNRYKFIMKTAQYMALGIVPVGTPLASNIEVIRHGENGFLAATDTEWAEYLTILVKDSKLRDTMSRQAAADALREYSLEANRKKIVAAFRSALG
jgi:glycosyltransferase involved in cell wall biosynthesis